MFALLIEFYYERRDNEHAHLLIEQMRGRNIILSPYDPMASCSWRVDAPGKAVVIQLESLDTEQEYVRAACLWCCLLLTQY